jgi:transmembrane sensor
LQASTAHRVAFLRLEAAWQHANRLKALGAGAKHGVVPPPGEWRLPPFSESGAGRDRQPPAAALAQGAELIQEDGAPLIGPYRRLRRLGQRPYAAVAASLLFITILGGIWSLWPPTGSSYSTAIGGLAAVPMPDGSRVTLNTDSAIRVAVTQTERKVNLEHGEAFFEVAKDPSRPFVVLAGDKRVVAVGTKFSVRRDRDEVRVAVSEGRVRVERAESRGGEAPATQVGAGAIARAGDAGVLVQQKSLPELEDGLSWRNGFLVFRDTPLADAVAEFNRYNTRKIVIEDPAVAAIRIGGNFRSTNVDAFVRLLARGFPIHAEPRGDQIALTGS